MPILHRCDRQVGCTVETWEGSVSFSEWLDHTTRLISDPAWPEGKKHLTDLRTMRIFTTFDSDLEEVSSLFSIYEERVRGLQFAIVALPKDHGAATKFSQFISRLGVSTFVSESLEDVCKWLAIDYPGTEKALNELRASLRGNRES